MTGASGLPALGIRRPMLVLVMNLLIALAGVAAFFAVDVRELPDVDRPIVMVRVQFPGASPETLDTEVTSIVEGAVARVSGVRSIRSSSEENNARVRSSSRPASIWTPRHPMCVRRSTVSSGNCRPGSKK